MGIFKWLLLPFSLIYSTITGIRNLFYDKGIFKSYTFKTPLICVGNLSVGGTGKSPMIEHLIKLYHDDYNVAVLSRGYKRETKGFLEVGSEMSAKQVGDEPLQFKRKFKGIKVFVDADRKNALEQIENHYPGIDLILLDDAYQHRRVKAQINILLTTYGKPFYSDYVLPMGRLRESRKGKNRADVIIVTKCPDKLSQSEIEDIKKQIKPDKNQQVLFSKISYDKKIYNNDETRNLEDFNDFLLVTGIANPKPLINHLNRLNKDYKYLNFPDHHNFKAKDIQKISAYKKPILTTEKDFTRLKAYFKENIFYLPIEVVLDKDLKSILKVKKLSQN